MEDVGPMTDIEKERLVAFQGRGAAPLLQPQASFTEDMEELVLS